MESEMSKYEVRPENVEAEMWNGSNAIPMTNMLGPHRVRESKAQTQKRLEVFDVASKEWLLVERGQYVVLLEDQSVRIMDKADFDAKYRPQTGRNPNWFPAQPTPWVPDRIGDPYPMRPIATWAEDGQLVTH